MVSLKEQLAMLADPAPAKEIDPEENGKYGSSEEESEVDEPLKREHYVQVDRSTLRETVLDDKKYGGKKTDLKSLYGQESESESESEEEEEDAEIQGDESEDESIDEDQSEEDGDEDDEEEDEDEGSEGEGEASENEDTKKSEIHKILAQEQKKIASHLSTAAKADAEKGQAVQHQMGIYEGALDLRINLQKALSAANVLPVDKSGLESVKTDETVDLQSEALESLLKLADKISRLRVELMQSNGIVTEKPKLSKKRKLDNAFENIQLLDDHVNKFRETTLDKWSRKIQSSSGSTALQSSRFKSLNQTAGVQVNAILADMDRLVKRTQTNRSQYKVLGLDQNTTTTTTVDATEEPYIFDDTDFYRLQLKELVDKRMADSSTATAGVKWAAAKSKSKKVVDTKASKGRKLRYNVDEKIQGFAAPRSMVFPWTNEQRDDLFSSLFGQSVRLQEEDSGSEAESEDEMPQVVQDGIKLF